jgi:hypothetical protein
MQSTDDFRNSTSLFQQAEMAALIQIQDADAPDAIFGAAHINVPIYDGLQSLELPGFNDGSIFAYEANSQDGLNVVQRKFLTKLRFVLINNHPDSTAPRCEEYVRDLAAHLCDCAGLDDGMNLVLLPCNLRLQIGEATFAAIADKECRRGRELACVIQEEKHRGTSTYLRGDLQIACAMIAATQHNYNLFQAIYPQKMLGIKIVADRVYFCAISPSEAYINNLLGGLEIHHGVTMFKFPTNGFSLSNPQERAAFLQHMSSLRSELEL